MDPKVKQKTLRLLSNGVYVMTSRHGERFGAATVTWVSQASFRPPLLMAAVRRESNVFRCLEASATVAIHIMGADQQAIAQKFFTPTKAGSGEINGEAFHECCTQAPILQSARAFIECRLRQIVDGDGDHAVVILEVVDAQYREPVRPLTIAESPWEYGG